MTYSARHQNQVRQINPARKMTTILWQDKPHVDVRDFYAKGDGSHDDTAAIQAALDASINLGVPCYIPQGTYKITNTLKFYTLTNSKDGYRLIGGGADLTHLYWYGPTNKAPIRILAGFAEVSSLHIVNQNGSGWLSAIEYDGSAANPGARSTSGVIRQVFIDGSSGTGDGIAIGRSAFQADSLEIDHCYIVHCPSGSGIRTYDPNSLSTNVLSTTIGFCQYGIYLGTSNNINVFGGEIDSNDINFVHGGGGPMTISGVRSENSKRAFWCNTGTFGTPFTLTGYHQSSINTVRPVTTGAIASGQTTLTLSTSGFISGDQITIAGAGVAGTTLSTTIATMTSRTVITVSDAASTTVTIGAVAIDATKTPVTLAENAVGPYTHIGCIFQGTTCAAKFSNGAQTWIGNYWDSNIYDPYGSVPGALALSSASSTQTGNYSNAGAHAMRNRLATKTPTQLPANSTAPSVLDLVSAWTLNSAPTAYTDFVDGVDGQVFHLVVDDSNTSFTNAGNIRTGTGGTVVASIGRMYTFLRLANVWWMGA